MALSKQHEKIVRDWLVETIGPRFTVESRNASVEVDVARIDLDLVPRGLKHGLTQRIADKVAGFKGKPVAEIKAAMSKVVDAIYQGEWEDQTALVYRVARGILAKLYPQADIPTKGTFAIRDDAGIAFWCKRLAETHPLERLPQGANPVKVKAKAEKIIREREADVAELA